MTNLFAINTEAAIYKDKKWLVGIRSTKDSEAGGSLSLIGGTVEHKDALIDTLENALIREIYEEIGVKVKVIDFVNDTSFISKRGNHVINVVMLCEIIAGEPKVISPDETESLVWLTIDEIIKHPNTTKWLCDSIKKAESLIK